MRLKIALIIGEILLAFGWYALSDTGRRAVVKSEKINADLVSRNQKLDKEIADLERVIAQCNDPFFIEKFAREECGLSKPGDDIYVM